MRRSNPDFLNGVPELLTIRLLARRAMHGYELVQALKEATAGSLAFGEGCIYPILHRLEAERVLSSKRVVVDGRQRLVYAVTAKGRKRLAESVSTWRDVSRSIARVLQGVADARPEMA
jgi:PadR family transcriptional regulator PadR